MRGRAVWAIGSGLSLWLASSAAQAQCTKDTDCKGDRICEAGKCTSPSPPPAQAPAAGTAPDAPAPSSDGAASADAVAAPTSADAVAAPASADAVAASANAVSQPPPAELPPPPATPPAVQAPTPPPPVAVTPLKDEPRVERRSRVAMVTGIIMVAIGPLALLGALSAKGSQEECDEDLERDYPNHRLPTSERYRLEKCDSYTAPLYVLGIGGAVMTVGGIPLIIYGAKNVSKPTPSAKLQVAPWATPQAGGVKVRLTL